MKDWTKILLVIIALLGGFASYLLGVVEHMYITWYAYETTNIFGALVTFSLPGFAEVFWIFPISKYAGSYWNLYTFALVITPLGTILKRAILSYLVKRETYD